MLELIQPTQNMCIKQNNHKLSTHFIVNTNKIKHNVYMVADAKLSVDLLGLICVCACPATE